MVVMVASLIPLLGFTIARRVGRYNCANAGALATHYGSVNVVTFAVASSFLMRQSVQAKGDVGVLRPNKF